MGQVGCTKHARSSFDVNNTNKVTTQSASAKEHTLKIKNVMSSMTQYNIALKSCPTTPTRDVYNACLLEIYCTRNLLFNITSCYDSSIKQFAIRMKEKEEVNTIYYNNNNNKTRIERKAILPCSTVALRCLYVLCTHTLRSW